MFTHIAQHSFISQAQSVRRLTASTPATLTRSHTVSVRMALSTQTVSTAWVSRVNMQIILSLLVRRNVQCRSTLSEATCRCVQLCYRQTTSCTASTAIYKSHVSTSLALVSLHFQVLWRWSSPTTRRPGSRLDTSSTCAALLSPLMISTMMTSVSPGSNKMATRLWKYRRTLVRGEHGRHQETSRKDRWFATKTKTNFRF